MLYRFALTSLVFVSMALSADFAGTWKLNTAKSKYDGIPMPKELTVTYASQGSGWRYAAKGIGQPGKPSTGRSPMRKMAKTSRPPDSRNSMQSSSRMGTRKNL
jgi:hypothetical protein